MLLVLVAIALILLIWVVMMYNQLVKLRNLVDEAWSGISVQLKRRFDLIPNLVETVKGYAGHEKSTLENVIHLRNAAMNAAPGDVAQLAQANAALSQGIKGVFALAENYPDLKANQNFIELQNALQTVEDNLQNSRRYYNACVRDLNTACESFPSVLIANAFGFAKRAFFELDTPEEAQNIKVSF
jgi:LemA protein